MCHDNVEGVDMCTIGALDGVPQCGMSSSRNGHVLCRYLYNSIVNLKKDLTLHVEHKEDCLSCH